MSSVPDWRQLLIGGLMQSCEAGTFGMPLEVWKTRNGAYPKESARQSFNAVLEGGGPRAFWRGLDAKLVEAFSKGGVLVFAKQYILDVCELCGMERTSPLAGTLGGAGGGVAQTIVMSPLTYVVTYAMKKPEAYRSEGMLKIMYNAGLRGCYSSAPAMAMRQGSNWALRQFFNDVFVGWAKKAKGGELNFAERVSIGLLAGVAACINQPVEVLRIRVQAEHVGGNGGVTTSAAARLVYRDSGALGFFAGIIPRFGLAAWQTLFMVTFADMLSDMMRKADAKRKQA
jgi:hypothetical protein